MERRKELQIALLAAMFVGVASGIFGAVVNNYLSDVHHFGAEARGWFELPREFPGFMMLFVAGMLLSRWRETEMAAIAMIFIVFGTIGYAFLSSSMAFLVFFTMLWSIGDHLIYTVETSIGLKLAHDGKEGKRLGQFGGAKNIGIIVGVVAIYSISKFWQGSYMTFFLFAAFAALMACLLYSMLRIDQEDGLRSARFVFRRRYCLFYAVSALFGVRKQIFMVFGIWVLVKLYHVNVSTVALLYFVAAAIGIVFRPLLGEVIDWVGERTVLMADQGFLGIICLSYAFASVVLPKPYDLYLLYVTFVMDSVLVALRIAIITYLKKIAEKPSDITPSVSVGITLDHAFSMTIPIFSGWVWDHWGYRYVFIIAACIAACGVGVCTRMTPQYVIRKKDPQFDLPLIGQEEVT